MTARSSTRSLPGNASASASSLAWNTVARATLAPCAPIRASTTTRTAQRGIADGLAELGAHEVGVVDVDERAERAHLEPAPAELRVRFPEQRRHARLPAGENVALPGVAGEERGADERSREKRVVEAHGAGEV